MCTNKPVGIIDYGSGNIQSIVNALNYLKIPNKIINNANDLQLFSKAILPGVGSFKTFLLINEFVFIPVAKIIRSVSISPREVLIDDNLPFL